MLSVRRCRPGGSLPIERKRKDNPLVLIVSSSKRVRFVPPQHENSRFTVFPENRRITARRHEHEICRAVFLLRTAINCRTLRALFYKGIECKYSGTEMVTFREFGRQLSMFFLRGGKKTPPSKIDTSTFKEHLYIGSQQIFSSVFIKYHSVLNVQWRRKVVKSRTLDNGTNLVTRVLKEIRNRFYDGIVRKTLSRRSENFLSFSLIQIGSRVLETDGHCVHNNIE